MLSRRYFPRLRTAASSSGRAASYAAEAARRRAAEGLDPAEYLRSLDMRVDIAPARPSDVMRLAELSARCSQFNVLTSRRTAPEIAALAADPRHVVLAVRAADRFGDYGTVAFAIARIDPGARAEIVDFVMSCRAMNRRIEFSVEEALEKELSARGVETLFARRDSTPKNAPVENLFAEFGFETVRVSGPSAFYRRRLAARPSPATPCPSASPVR
jgi:FkbH-like protein